MLAYKGLKNKGKVQLVISKGRHGCLREQSLTRAFDDNQVSYNQRSSNQDYYNQWSYNQDSFNQVSYNEGSYNQDSYNQGSYNQDSYNQGS